MNIVAFAWDGVDNIGFALFFKKNAINIEEAEELICYTSKDKDGREVFTEVTDLAERETSLIGLSTRFVF